MDTAKVTNEMGSESARILGSASRVGRRGWGNLWRERAMVRKGWWGARGNSAEEIGKGRAKDGILGEEGDVLLLPSRQESHYLDVVSCVQGRREAQHCCQKHLKTDTLGPRKRLEPGLT